MQHSGCTRFFCGYLPLSVPEQLIRSLKKPCDNVSALLTSPVEKDVFQSAYFYNKIGRPLRFYVPKLIQNFDDLNRRKQFRALTFLLKFCGRDVR